MILPKLHFIWVGGGEFKKSYEHGIRSAQQNTSFEIFLHTDQAIDISGVTTIHVEAPDIKTSCLAHLSDIIRCDVLYEHGGVYSDLDVIWLRDPWEFMDKKVVIGYTTEQYKILCNAVLMSEKGHPAIKKYKDWLLSIMPCKKYWIPANPYKIWKDDPDVLMIKRKYFFPVNHRRIPEATLEDFKDSIGAHLFASMHDLDSHYRRIFGTIFDRSSPPPIKIEARTPPKTSPAPSL